MTMNEADALLENAINEHSRVVERVLAVQSKVEKVLSERKNSSAKDSTLIAAVVVEVVEEEVEREGSPVEGFWKMFGPNAVGA
jgi:phosphosulfolactate phosphohydrolase-like enzyme